MAKLEELQRRVEELRAKIERRTKRVNRLDKKVGRARDRRNSTIRKLDRVQAELAKATTDREPVATP